MSGIEGQSGPPGNKNASLEKRQFSNAIRRAGLQEEGKRLRKVVDALYDKAEAGDVQAAKEIADRFDGKAQQEVIGDLTLRNRASDMTDDELAAIAVKKNAGSTTPT